MSIDHLAMIAVLLPSLSWHEAAHAWVADRLGDPTARSLGRVTLNPLKHLDPFLSVLLPIVMLQTTGMLFGGGKPVPVQPGEFRHPARDFMFVALAGPFSNLVLAAGFVAGFVVLAWTGVFEATTIADAYAPEGHRVFLPTLEGVSDQGFLGALIAWGVTLNVLLAVFNLIPLPPLDGSRVVGWILPEALQRHWYGLDRFGLLLLLIFFFAPGRFGMKVVWALFQPVRQVYLEAAAQLVSMGPIPVPGA